MGYDTLQAKYLTIPVYIWGATVFVVVARLSDKYRVRGAVSLFIYQLTLVYFSF